MKQFFGSGRTIPIDILDPETNFRFNLANRDITYHMSDLHGLELYQKQPEIVDRIWRGARELIMIHREYGKSTMAEDVVINDLIFEKNAFIMYFSATMDSAQDHTRAVMNFFMKDTLPNGKPNPLNDLVPERGDKNFKWRESDFVLRNGNRCKAAGLDKFVLGKREMDMRPTRIIIDDPVKKEPGFDEDTIETFYKTILPMGGPMTRITVIGTPRRYSDIIMELKNDYEQSFNVHFFPAVYPDGRIMSQMFWMRKGACCYDDRYICGSLEGEALVLQHIEQKKREVKSLAWATEYLLQPVDDESSLFPMPLLLENKNRAWSFKASRIQYTGFQNGYTSDERPTTVIGCDHAFTTSDTSDYSVFTVLAVMPERHIKILDIWRGKLNFEGQKQKLHDLARLYRPSLIYSEKNQSQIVFAEDMSIYQQHLPIKPFLTHSNKNALDVGVPSMVSYFENRVFDVPYGDEQTKKLVDTLFRELNGVTIKNGKVKTATKNDDMMMSLWIALNAATDVAYNQVTSFGGISFANLDAPETYQANAKEDHVLYLDPFSGQRGAYN